MIYKFTFFFKFISTIYASFSINLLFLFSICFTLDLAEKAFSNSELFVTIKYLFLSLIPLSIWGIVNHTFFPKKVTFIAYQNLIKNRQFSFGLFCLSFTLTSIARDIYLLKIDKIHLIPAGILGKLLSFIVKLDHFYWPHLSGWLIARYVFILLFIYSLSSRTLINSWIMAKNELPILRKNDQEKNEDNPKTTQTKSKLSGKKLTYIK